MTEETNAQVQHVIRLSHVPYGFFEKEMYGYFSQFGKVKRVRMIRNKKGNPTGIAFVEFKNAQVAAIAAQTMDNYLLAENRLRCRVLEPNEVPLMIRSGGRFGKIVKPGENRQRHANERFKEKTALQEENQRRRFVYQLRKRMAKIQDLGINYQFEFEEKLSKFEEQKRAMDEEAAEKNTEADDGTKEEGNDQKF